MRKSFFCTACLLLLTGCVGKTPDSTVVPATDLSTDATVVTLNTTETSNQSSLSYDTEPSTEAALTSVSSEASSQQTATSGTTASVTTLAQGGQGGEDHASDPDPDYFTYRFFPDSVSMRLAGGNYQTVFYDFAEAVAHDAAELFYLSDFNYDGKPDLAVPVRFSGDNITDAVFLWNADTSLFETEPVLLCNPITDQETKTVVCLTYDQNTGAEIKLQFLSWSDKEPAEIRTVSADYTALTLTDNGQDGETVSQYDTTELLHKAILSLIPSDSVHFTEN